MTEQIQQSEEDTLNTKRLMEQSVPFHAESSLLRNIYFQWVNGKALTDRQKRASIVEIDRLQQKATQHKQSYDCQQHRVIYVQVTMLSDVRSFEGQDGIIYSPRKGNVLRLPLREATALVFQRYVDFQITNALSLSDRREVHHHV